MRDDNPHLRSVLRAGAVEQSPTDEDSGLPSLREGEYQAFARPSNKPIYDIHFVDPKGEVRSYQYVHLDSDSRFTAERITLRFLGMEPAKVTIAGRNLWRLYDYIHQHRMTWVMTAARDFATDGQPIVTDISFMVLRESDGG
jgi:hypothetical protein